MRLVECKFPQDLSLVGFGDSQLATRIHRALTTVRLLVRELGRLAARIVIAKTSGRPPPPRARIDLNPSLVVRESTAAPAD